MRVFLTRLLLAAAGMVYVYCEVMEYDGGSLIKTLMDGGLYRDGYDRVRGSEKTTVA